MKFEDKKRDGNKYPSLQQWWNSKQRLRSAHLPSQLQRQTFANSEFDCCPTTKQWIATYFCSQHEHSSTATIPTNRRGRGKQFSAFKQRPIQSQQASKAFTAAKWCDQCVGPPFIHSVGIASAADEKFRSTGAKKALDRCHGTHHTSLSNSGQLLQPT